MFSYNLVVLIIHLLFSSHTDMSLKLDNQYEKLIESGATEVRFKMGEQSLYILILYFGFLVISFCKKHVLG